MHQVHCDALNAEKMFTIRRTATIHFASLASRASVKSFRSMNQRHLLQRQLFEELWKCAIYCNELNAGTNVYNTIDGYNSIYILNFRELLYNHWAANESRYFSNASPPKQRGKTRCNHLGNECMKQMFYNTDDSQHILLLFMQTELLLNLF